MAQKLARHNFSYTITSSNNELIALLESGTICNNTITKDLITPEVCRYTTLSNVSVLKVTTEKDFCNNTF